MDVKKGDTIICKKEFTLAGHNFILNQKYIIKGDGIIGGKRVLTISIKGGERYLGSLRNIYESTLNNNFENKWDKRKRIIDEL